MLGKVASVFLMSRYGSIQSSGHQGREKIAKFTMVACCLLLTGCVTHQSYPSSFPAPVKATGVDCPDLSGRYRNAPIDCASGTDSFAMLYDALTNEGVFGTHQCADCIVQVQWLDDTHDALRLRLIYPANPPLLPHDEVETLRRSRGEFDCRDGGLTVALTRGATEISNTILNWGHRTFWRAQDGSLVALEKGQFTGYVIFVIPFYAKYESYIRWRSTDATDNNLVEAPAISTETTPLEDRLRILTEQGVTPAERELAFMEIAEVHWKRGIYPQDYVDAYMWFSIVAVTSESPEMRANATRNRDLVASKLDATQIAEAEQGMHGWTEAFTKIHQEQPMSKLGIVP